MKMKNLKIIKRKTSDLMFITTTLYAAKNSVCTTFMQLKTLKNNALNLSLS